MHRRQVELESVDGGPRRMNLEQPFLDPAIEAETYRAHVAHVLRRRFLELETDRAFAAAARGVEKVGGERRLGGAGAARQQHAARAEIPGAAEHLVEPLDPGRDAFGARLV